MPEPEQAAPSGPDRRRKSYRGEHLRAVAMPLGGIGTGSIALGGDGSLRQWQISNRINHLACLPHSFFALWFQPAGGEAPPIARVLQSGALYDSAGPTPPPTSNDEIVPEAHRSLLQTLPGMAETEFAGEYPIAEITYRDPAVPLRVSLEAFSPFIPLDAKDSGLPAVLFNFTIANPTAGPCLASMAASLQNGVGWDGIRQITGIHNTGYGGNANTLHRLPGGLAIHMTGTRLTADDEDFGSLALACLSPEATCWTQWDDLQAFWQQFEAQGQMPLGSAGASSPHGQTWNGAVAAPFTLEPGESRTIGLVVAWHFPNRYFDYGQRHYRVLLGMGDSQSKHRVGNQYANWFGSALDVVHYVQANAARLTEQTRLARDTFYDTTLPGAVIDSVTSQISVLRSPTCFWAQDGRFYGFEGCGGASTPKNAAIGSCPLNCTHVWNYEMALARLFPDLERTMRETEWNVQQLPTGSLPHRVRLPLDLPRPGERDLPGPDRAALDGLLGGILKTYREYRACGDLAWLRHMWPGVEKALRYVWAEYDSGQSGVITGEQPNTYDVSVYGANTFIGTLYLAALRAAEAMADRLGEAEHELAADCRTVFRRGREVIEARLWNGEYYVHEADLEVHPDQSWGPGCHADQLLGQWWAHQLGLGHLLEPDRVRRAALAIFRHNFRQDFHNHEQRPRAFVTATDQGLLNCTWPTGGRPAIPLLYSDEVWTGIEYEVAALLLFEGEPAAAVRLLEAVQVRYDGRKQNPWNNIECGDHYARAMAAWSLLEAASGFTHDAGQAALGFAPSLNRDDFRAPFITQRGGGTYSQRIMAATMTVGLRLVHGSLTLSRLCLHPPGAVASAAAALDGRDLSLHFTQDSESVVLTFPTTLTVEAGALLAITLVLRAGA